MADEYAYPEEAAPLLNNVNTEEIATSRTVVSAQVYLRPHHALPMALLAALAMSSTAATSYYAYATLLCKDATHCEGDERSRYASTVAITTSVANITGMLALGHLQKLSTTSSRAALTLWMVARSMNAIMLLLGVSLGSILVALGGRVFEGLASDNLLHFVLNSVYSQAESQQETSSLIGYSLGLYLAGISVSPFVAGLFKNFTISFFIAIVLFAFAIFYLQAFVSGSSPHPSESEPASTQRSSRNRPNQIINTVLTPLETFKSHPTAVLIGLSLFFYNIVQSYIFNALLVHTSLQFGFTGYENGLLISIAHSVAALYIFMSLYAAPKIWKAFRRGKEPRDATEGSEKTTLRDSSLAVSSFIILIASLIGFGFARDAVQIYLLTAMLALSLPLPSFIKAALLNRFEGDDKSKALASLAAMETLGAVLGPVALGGLQSYTVSGTTVFFVAAAFASSSLVLFVFGSINVRSRTRTLERHDH